MGSLPLVQYVYKYKNEECSSYSTCRDNFQEGLKQLLGARYAEFETLSAVEKTSYVLGIAKAGRMTSTLCCI